MFIVPSSGDVIETTNGVTYTVLGFSNYADQPAALVQAEGASTESVSFDEIAKINRAPVTLTSSKIFTGVAKHGVSLPQKDDKVTTSSGVIKVDNLKLHNKGQLAKGLIIVGTNVDTSEKMTVRFADVTSILLANGSEVKNLKAVKTKFQDYIGVQGKSQ